MGADTELYLDTKYSWTDIATVLENHPMLVDFEELSPEAPLASRHNRKVKFQIVPTHSPDYHCINIKTKSGSKRSISFHTNYNCESGFGRKHLFTLGAGEEAVEIFKYMQRIFGGIIIEDDCKDENKILSDIGRLSPSDGLPFFLAYAIKRGKITSENEGQTYEQQLQILKEEIEFWENRHNNRRYR